MNVGKRQLVLAALVLALGAAVYLNFIFTGNNNKLLPTDTVASQKELGETVLVNDSVNNSSTGSGAAKNSSAVTANAKADEYFSQTRLSRQKARDQSAELLKKVLTDEKQSDTAKKEAVTQTVAIVKNVTKENNIENLVKAKGYIECVAFIQDSQCNVVVQKNGELLPNDTVVIKDIVSAQTGISYDKIQIVVPK